MVPQIATMAQKKRTAKTFLLRMKSFNLARGPAKDHASQKRCAYALVTRRRGVLSSAAAFTRGARASWPSTGDSIGRWRKLGARLDFEEGGRESFARRVRSVRDLYQQHRFVLGFVEARDHRDVPQNVSANTCRSAERISVPV
jgi:hypothetical protein